jgi:hypothetical protein
MSRRKARRNHERPVLQPFSRLERRERERAHWRRDNLAADGLRRGAEIAMQRFKQSLRAGTLKSIGEFKSRKTEVLAQMKRTGRPRVSAVRHIPITPENEQEALRLLASRSKACPPDGIETMATDVNGGTTGRDHTASAVRKQDGAVARTAIPTDEKPASRQVGAVIRAADVGAPRQAVTG